MATFSLVLSTALLGACTTTITEEEDRVLPEVEEMMDEVAAADTVTADMDESYIAFTGTKGEEKVHEGKFNQYTFSMKREEGEPKSIELEIGIGSMETEIDGLTTHLLSEDFFDAESFPTATFSSKSIEPVVDNTYTVTGNLTMHGVTESVTLDATITSAYLTLRHVLDRTTYGIGDPEALDTAVPLDVKIVFETN